MFDFFKSETQESLVGKTLNNQYALSERIGEGAYGDVYRAEHVMLKRKAAIKVLKARWSNDAERKSFLANFDFEARLTSQVNHPNAVTVYDYGIYDKDLLYLVMEFIDGQTLSTYLRDQKNPVSLQRVYEIIKQVCAALSQAHSLSIVHRDLKPDNIMLSRSAQGEEIVKVLDFGIAKIMGLETKDDNQIFGTPRYMSPEQCAGESVDARSDIYALGIILYELLSHRCHPFPQAKPAIEFFQHHMNKVKPTALIKANPEVRISSEIDRVVMQCLERKPEHRYASVIELLSDLKKAFFGLPSELLDDDKQVQSISMDEMLDAYDTAHVQFKQGNYARAFEQMHILIERKILDPQLIYLAILSLVRSGASELAMNYWQRYETVLPETEDNLALKARLLKDQYKQASMPQKLQLGIQAKDEYLKIAELTSGYYPLINAATLAFWLGNQEQANTLAQQVLDTCKSEPEDYWNLVTKAEACLLIIDCKVSSTLCVVIKLLQQLHQSGYSPPALALEKILSTEATLSYRSQFKIIESNEPLLELKPTKLSLFQPHPHANIGALYNQYSPFCIRTGVLSRLEKAQTILELKHPGYKLHIYDAYRPLTVQQFMIDHEFSKLCQSRLINPLDTNTRQSLMDEVMSVWAHPESNPALPPPHSTGAAVDLTIINERGLLLDMGSDIDSIGAVSLPNHFAKAKQQPQTDFYSNRELLNQVMTAAGFRRLPHEWWHFSYGDQIWALLQWLDNPKQPVNAIYGRIE